MSDEIVDIVSLRSPLPKIKLPNGRVLPVMEATALTERLRRDVVADPGNEQKVRAVLKNLVPDATDEDWETCTTEDVRNIYDVALRKTTAALALVEDRRKNDDGETGGSPGKRKKPRTTPPSSPTTTSITSAPKSGKSRAAGGAT